MMLAKPREEKDYGVVTMDAQQRVTGFNEKSSSVEGDHHLNAGIYLLQKDAFVGMPDGAFSLETEFFPRLVAEKASFYAFPIDGHVVDIGTPSRFSHAQTVSFGGNK